MTHAINRINTPPHRRSWAGKPMGCRDVVMGVVVGLAGLWMAGCGANIPVYQVSIETIEVPRANHTLEGNRGYIVGEPPETIPEAEPQPTTRKITALSIKKGKSIRFEPWKAIMALDRWIREHMW